MGHSDDTAQELLTLECPQNWLQPTSHKYLERIVIQCNMSDEELKYKEDDDNMPGGAVYKYWYLLTNIIWKYMEEKYDDGFELLDSALLLIDEFGKFGKKFEKSFKYVLNAMKAFFYWKQNKLQMKTEICELIRNEEYSRIDMSGICYIKYLFLSKFAESESAEALKAIKNAHKLNPDEYEFIYCIASLMTRIRNYSWPRSPPSVLELMRVKYLHKQNPDSARYALQLARMYSEMQIDKSKNSHYWEKAVEIAESCLQNYGAKMTTSFVAKAVFFLIKLGYRKIEIYEDLVREVLLREPFHIKSQHYFGIFFSSIGKLEEALKCYTVALRELPYLLGSVLYLRSALYIDEDNTIFIEDTLSQYEEYMDIHEALLGISEFYLMVKSDLEKAAEYFIKADCKNVMKYTLSCCKKRVVYCELLKAELVNNFYKYEDNEDVLHNALNLLSSVKNKNYLVAYSRKWMY